MSQKELKIRRMWTYFIDATEELIKSEGVQQVTIRKVAEKAGYNSATIYNYFDEFSHLLFFASLKFLKPYLETVTNKMKMEDDPVKKYLTAWECFSEYSFRNPEIFHTVFLMDLGAHPKNMLKKYYELYPADLFNIPEELHPLIMDRNITARGRYALNSMVQLGIIEGEQAEELNELTNLIWQSMFTNYLNNRAHYDAKEAHERTMKYVRKMVDSMIEGKL